MEEFVSLKQLAAELGLDRSNTRKYVLKSGVRPHKRRTPDSGSQLTLALTMEEADRIRAKRRDEGFLGASKAVVREAGISTLSVWSPIWTRDGSSSALLTTSGVASPSTERPPRPPCW